MKELIRQAYALKTANDRFNNITKADILELYRSLDTIYDMLESLEIVSKYSGFKLLKDFEVVVCSGNVKCINPIGTTRFKPIPIDVLTQELVYMFENI